MLLAKWCRTAGLLFQAGVPEAATVALAGESSGNTRVEQASRNAGAQVERGVRLGDAMYQEPFFPTELGWMVATSEKAGGHQHVWPVAHALYRQQAEDSAQLASIFLRLIFAVLAFQVVGITLFVLLTPIFVTLRLLMGFGLW
jgi:type II secretory pathway component PulF